MRKKEKLKLGLKLGKEFKRIPHKYGHFVWDFLKLLPQLHPRYAIDTSTKNNLQH